MANKKDRVKTAKEDRIGSKMRHASKGLKKTKIWNDSMKWFENDLRQN